MEEARDDAPDERPPAIPLHRVHEWAAAPTPPCPPVLFHDLLLQQERRTPYNSVLALGDGGHVTYRALCTASRALAGTLRRAGVRAGALVGLLAVRSLEMVVGMLGILLANAGYVPLMPDFPEDRLRFILDDAACEVLAASQRFWRQATALRGKATIQLDAFAAGLSSGVWKSPTGERVTETTRSEFRPPWSSPMVVLYTSGSTGKPKGVNMDHQHFVTHFVGYARIFRFRAADKGFQQATYTFGLHTSEIFPLMMVGGTVLLAAEGFVNLEVFSARAMNPRDGITIIMSVPSVVAAAIAEASFVPVPSTAHVICIGEPFPADLYTKLCAIPDTRFSIVCAYGCTETHVNTTWHSAPGARREVTTVNVPVGAATPWHGVHIVSDGGRLPRRGDTGECILSGRGLAIGYLNRPEAMRKAFVSDPFGSGRAYRTGDLVRWLIADDESSESAPVSGALEFLGRRDFQVKLRGQRIELGEIETVLREQPGVTEAVVLLSSDFPDKQPRLIAYVSPPAVATDATLDRCRKGLPSYMVPSVITGVSEWPRTRSGKMDRMGVARLPMALETRRSGQPFRAPEGCFETAVTEAMAAVLSLDALGADDDFVRLGGHSLLAVRLQSKLQGLIIEGASLPPLEVHELLKLRTPARIAHWLMQGSGAHASNNDAESPARLPSVLDWCRSVEARQPKDGIPLACLLAAEAGLSRPSVEGVTAEVRYPVSLYQEQLILADTPVSASYSVVFSFWVSGQLDRTALEGALRSVIARHRVLAGTYELNQVTTPASSGELVGVSSYVHCVQLQTSPENVVLHSEWHSAPTVDAARELAEDCAARPLEFLERPCGVVKMSVASTSEDAHLVTLVLHHSVIDGSSLSVLWRELRWAYAALACGEASRIAAEPPLSVQYDDFACWQRAMLAQWPHAASEDLDYWKEQLRHGAVSILELPTDRPRPALRSSAGSIVRLSLPTDAVGRAAECFRAQGATLFQGLLAAWANLLGHLGGQREVVVGTPFSWRDAGNEELQGLIGYFINMLAIRLDNVGEESFQESVARLSNTVLTAMRHAFLPFLEISSRLTKRVHDPSRTPIFQSMFAWEMEGGGWLQELDAEKCAFGQHATMKPDRTISTHSSKCDVRVELCRRSNGELCGELEYCTALFEEATAQHMARCFLSLLRSVPASPRAGLSAMLGALVRPVSQWEALLSMAAGEGWVSVAGLPFSGMPPGDLEASWSWVGDLPYSDHEDELERLAYAAVATGIALCRLSRCTAALLAVALLAQGRLALYPVQISCASSALFKDLVGQCCEQLRAAVNCTASSASALVSSGSAKALETLKGASESLDESRLWVVIGDVSSLDAVRASPLRVRLGTKGLEVSGHGLGSSMLSAVCSSLGAILGAGCVQQGSADVSLAELPMMSPSQRQALLQDFNDTAHDFQGSGHFLHELVRLRSKELPAGHIALTEGDQGERRTTYRELLDLSASLAKSLAANGVTSGALVALWMPRSRMVVVCALAVMEAGAAYLPCDLSLPFDRVSYMLEVSGTCLLIADATRRALLPGDFVGCSVLALESLLREDSVEPWSITRAEDDTNDSWQAPMEEDDPTSRLAYVIFTSGSTGRPKGVAISHRSIVHLVEWVNRVFQVTEQDTLLFVTSIGFDLSCYDMFGSLAAGSCIRIAKPGASPEDLFEIVSSGGITFWDSAPPVLQQLEHFLESHAAAGKVMDKLRLVFMSGDWVPIPLVSVLQRACPSAQVVALGGATEVTVWSNFFLVDEIDSSWHSIPYGAPIWNHQYYSLDSDLAPAHIGVAGDLYIGGIGVAREYIGRPDLTAERFISNPFHEDRMYKTGDLVRFMPLRPWGSFNSEVKATNLTMEFLGRADSQVKIRGFRVELGEIERVCEAVPGVKAAVVMALSLSGSKPGSGPARGDLQLVAFVTPAVVETSAVKAALGQSLPSYMVPELVVLLEVLPLSTNGKVDRKALQAMDIKHNALQSLGRKPTRALSTELEALVAKSFAEVLGLPSSVEVNADDDFFELGGQSLLALRLQNHLKASGSSKVSATLEDIFRLRTPARIAAELAGGQYNSEFSTPAPPPLGAVASQVGGSPGGQVDCYTADASFAQERLWLTDQLSPGQDTYNIPFAYRLSGPLLSLSRLCFALQRLVARHEVFRTVLRQRPDGTLSQCVLATEPLRTPDGRVWVGGQDGDMDESALLGFGAPTGGSDGKIPEHQLTSWMWAYDYRSLTAQVADKHLLPTLHEDVHKGFDLAQGVFRVRIFLLPPSNTQWSPAMPTFSPVSSPFVRERAPRDGMKDEDLSRQGSGCSVCFEEQGSRCLLYINVHHIAFDGVSLHLLEQDLWRFYRGDKLEPMDAQYTDYSVWHRRWLLEGGELRRGLQCWMKELDGATFLLDLPTDFPRPAKLELDGSAFTVPIPGSTAAGIREFGRVRKVTEFRALLAVYALLLSRQCQQTDLLVGMPVAARQHSDKLESLVGFFVNTVAIRVNFNVLGNAPYPCFNDILEEVDKRVLSALRNSEVPWQVLVKELRQSLGQLPERASPVVQTMFDFNMAGEFDFHHGFDHQDTAGVAPGVVSEAWAVRKSCRRLDPVCPGAGKQSAKFEIGIDLSFNAPTGGYAMLWEFSTSLFQEATVRSWGRHFVSLLQQIGSGRTSPADLWGISAAPRRERSFVLHEWSAANSAPLPELSVHEAIFAQARRTPWSRALTMDGHVVSFRSLVAGAEDVCQRLKSADVGVGAFVGLLMVRSLNMMYAMLGSLMLGAAYVPMAPDLPEERLCFIATDARLAAIAVSADFLELAHKVASGSGAAPQVVHVDSVRSRSKHVAALNGGCLSVQNSSAMYILYTSGTSGQPKGVVVPHRAAASHVLACVQKFDLAAFDQVLQSISLSFDFAVSQLFPYLVAGGSVLLPPEETCKDPHALAELVAAGHATSVDFVPTMFSFFMESSHLRQLLSSVRRVNLGGEAVPSLLCQQVLRHLNARVFVTYGPTEVAVDTTTLEVFGPYSPVTSSPIGHPDVWRSLHVLRHGAQADFASIGVPSGSPGELCVEGPGVALGYLNRADQTSSAFVQSAFTSGITYRTGDLVRWRGQLGLDFLGRIDSQIKLRGQRIELGEVETVLREFPDITEVVVMVLSASGKNDEMLVAFASTGSSVKDVRSELLTMASSRLPAYMVPRFVFVVETWPRTSAGKLDHRALRKLALEKLEKEAEEHASAKGSERDSGNAVTSPEVKCLAEVIASVLRKDIDAADCRQSFARLGGDSIAAIRAVERLRQKGLSISPAQLLSKLSLEDVSKSLEGTVDDGLPNLESVSGVIPLGPMQSRFFELGMKWPHHYNQSQLLALHRPLSRARIAQAMTRLATSHDMLRSRYVALPSGSMRQVVLPAKAASVAVTVTETTVKFQQLEREIASVQGSLNLSEGPICAAALLHVEGLGDRLFIVIHHLVVDIVSWNVLLDDLAEDLAIDDAGTVTLEKPSSKGMSYKQWLEMKRSREKACLPRGISSCANFKDATLLPFSASHSHDRSLNTWASARRLRVEVDAASSSCLLGTANDAYDTKAVELLLVALVESHAQFKLEDDPSSGTAFFIDLEGHGRDPTLRGLGVTRTVGWFTSLCPAVLCPGSSLHETIRETKERYRSLALDGGSLRLSSHMWGNQNEVAPSVCFNYHGQTSGTSGGTGDAVIFTSSAEQAMSCTHDVHPENMREYLLEIECGVECSTADDGSLCQTLWFEWIYSPDYLDKVRLQTWLQILVSEIARVGAHCLDVLQHPDGIQRLTPSHFPLLRGISVSEFDALLQIIPRSIAIKDLQEVEDVYPCTPLQEGLLMETIMDQSANVEQNILRLRGSLDAVRWRSVWTALVSRHEILRTRFLQHSMTTQLAQGSQNFWQMLLRPDSPSAVPEWTEKNWDATNYLEQLLDYLQQDRARGFEFAGPMVRFALLALHNVQNAAEEHIFIWSEHHALTDGWSFPIMLREALSLYDRQTLTCEAPSFRSYVDHAMQRDLEGMRAFWQQQFKGWRRPTENKLPLASPSGRELEQRSSATQAPRFAQLRGTLQVTVQELSHLGQGCNATLATVLHAAWALVLANVTAATDIVFGVVLSGRDVPVSKVEQMVGLLICTLPLRLRFEHGTLLESFLQSTQDMLLSAASFQHCNFAEISEWCGFHGSTGDLFHTLLNIESFPEETQREQTSLQAEFFNSDDLPVTGAELPLAMIVGTHGNVLQLTLRYDVALYDAACMESILVKFQSLLGALPLLRESSCGELVDAMPLLGQVASPEDMECLAWHQRWSRLLRPRDDLVSMSALPLAGSNAEESRQLRFKMPKLELSPSADGVMLAVTVVALGVSLCRLARCSTSLMVVAKPAPAPPVLIELKCDPDVELAELLRACMHQLQSDHHEHLTVLPERWLGTLGSSAHDGHVWSMLGTDPALSHMCKFIEPHIKVKLSDRNAATSLTSRFGNTFISILSSTLEQFLNTEAPSLTAGHENGSRRALVSEFKLLSQSVRKTLVEDFNNTSHDSKDRGLLLHELFERTVQRVSPSQIALVEGQDSGAACKTTYHELAKVVGELVHVLESLGVHRHGKVALWLPRDRVTVACMMAVLKAGGVYVPCDESLPFDRVNYMVDISKACLLLTDCKHRDLIPSDFCTSKVAVIESLIQVESGALQVIWDGDDRKQDVAQTAQAVDSLAYIIFTSGSTGKPKGVAIEHQSIVHLVEWVNTTFHVTTDDVLLFTTSIGFDLSCYDMFGSLAAGSQILIAPPKATPRQLFELLQSHSVTFWDSAPAVLQQLQDEMSSLSIGSRSLEHLRLVFMSGDWIPLPLVSLLHQVCPKAKVVALGGATEVTVWSNYFVTTHVDPQWNSVPYGRPIWNHQYYALGGDGQPVHFGMPGDLYIGGIGVAHEYVGRPELTAERFVENPFHGGTMYKLGDLVRAMPLSPWGVLKADGNCDPQNVVLEFLGRADFQVKVRGHRVELGEVEQALEGCTEVEAAVVLAVTSGSAGKGAASAEKHLAAFVTPEGMDVNAVKESLRQTLPEYMIPSTFVPMKALPLNTSGKVDRAALRNMDLAAATRVLRAYRQPQTQLEEMVARVFSETLGLSTPVGLDDDFFELGGHSLSALRLRARLREGCPSAAQSLELQDLFSLRTPARLAKALGAKAGTELAHDSSSNARQPPPLESRSATSAAMLEVEASFAQERLWLVEQLSPGQPTYNITLAYRVSGLEACVSRLVAALYRVVEKHEVLRTALRPQTGGGKLFQHIMAMEPFPDIDKLLDESATQCPEGLRLNSWAWLHNLERLPLPQAEAASFEAAQRDATQGFSLDQGVLRVRLFQMRWSSQAGTGECLDEGLPDAAHKMLLLYVNVHHVAFDDFSVGIFERDLWAAYDAASLAPLPIQYADYACWQRRWLLEGGELEHGLGYWKRELDGAALFLDLPTDHPYPAQLGSSGASFTVRPPKAWSQGLQTLATSHQTTEMRILLALYGIVLSRHCRQTDVLIGIPEGAGRSHDAKLDGLIGFFVNTLPVRMRLTDTLRAPDGSGSKGSQLSFASVVRDVHRSVMGALEHASLPWQLLVAELRKAHPELQDSRGRAPVLQAFFQHMNSSEFMHSNAPTPSGVECEAWNFRGTPTQEPVKFELSLHSVGGAGVHGDSAHDHTLLWEYSTEILQESTVRVFNRHLVELGKAVLEQPEVPLYRLPMGGRRERSALLHDWTTSTSTALPQLSIQDLLLQQGKRTPHQSAVTMHSSGSTMSYGVLMRAASAVAGILEECLGPEADNSKPRSGARPVLVGVLAGRSLEMIVGICGTLLAGAGFVPLSPELPRERLRFIAQDSALRAVVATSKLLELAWSLGVTNVLDTTRIVQAKWRNAGRSSHDSPSPCTSPSDPVYALYTSGSTGRPKAVLLSHGALLSHLLPYLQILGLGPRDRILLTSPFTFDMAYSQVFGAFLSGAQLVVTAENPMVDCAELAAVLRSEHISFAALVPSVLSAFLLGQRPPAALRHVGCGGEALPTTVARRFFDAPRVRSRPHRQSQQLHNRYGPTECAVNAVLMGPLLGDTARGSDQLWHSYGSVPIGWPSAHRHAFLQDGTSEVGETCSGGPAVLSHGGQLLLAGPGLAKHYIGRPDLTGQQFVESPFGAGRVYKTGDLARHVGSRGCLLYSGRMDFQVKLQGQRIELGEIEAVLRQQPGVANAVVVLQRSAPRSTRGGATGRLVAFVSPPLADGGAMALAGCKNRLPSYMVPRRIWGIPDWPRTASGKIDRKALEDYGSQAETRQPVRTASPEDSPKQERGADILQAVLAEVLDKSLSDITADMPLATLGLTSLLAVHAATLATDRGLPGVSVRGLLGLDATVADVATAASGKVSSGLAQEGMHWRELLALLAGGGSEGIVARRLVEKSASLAGTRTAQVEPLFICPGDGGCGCDGYRPLALQMQALTSTYVFDGLMGEPFEGVPPLDSMEELAARCVTTANGLVERGQSYRLIGHSWGAMLALEAARQLEDSGQTVNFVCLLDPSAEMFASSDQVLEKIETKPPAPAANDGWFQSVLCMGGRDVGDGTEELAPSFRNAVALSDLLQLLVRGGAIDLAEDVQRSLQCNDAIQTVRVAQEQLDAESFAEAQAVATARAHNLSMRPPHWPRFPRPLRARVLLVMAMDQVSDEWSRVEKRTLLTSALSEVAEDVTTVWTPGDHYSMLAPPNCEVLARTIISALELM